MTLKELAKAYTDREYMGSSVPEHARPVKTFRDNNANELTKSILAYFKIKGWAAYRQASEGRFIQGRSYQNEMTGRMQQERGKYIPRSKSNKGSGDVTVTMAPLARRLEIEIKYGNDRQSDVQKTFQAQHEAMGGIYIIVKTWEDFFFQMQKIEEQNARLAAAL